MASQNYMINKKIALDHSIFPKWEDFKHMMNGIFDRAYYSHQGPLCVEFEQKLCNLLRVKHVIALTNESIALMLALKALNLPSQAQILTPVNAFPSVIQAIYWAGYRPLFCDIDSQSHLIDVKNVEMSVKQADAILGVHLWGNICPVYELENIATKYAIPLLFEASHSIGDSYQSMAVGNFGLAEIFSFHSSQALSCFEGGAVTTNNDDFAEIIRNLRSSYGRRKIVEIPVNCNGRFSEFQAGMGLLSLEDFTQRYKGNIIQLTLYRKLLSTISGVQLVIPNNDLSHMQFCTVLIDKNKYGLSRDKLISLLDDKGIESKAPFVHPYNYHSFPNAKELASTSLCLPLGPQVSHDNIVMICNIIENYTLKLSSKALL